MARARHKALQWSVAPVVVKSLTQRTSRLLLVVAAVLALSVNVLGGLANAADPIYRAEYVRTPSPTVTSFTSELLTLTFPIRNTGDAVWAAAGTNPVRLSYHWYDLAGRVVVWDGLRTSIVTDHAAGQERQYEMKVMTPGAPGEYVLQIDLLREGIAWFSWMGTPTSPQRYALSHGYGATYQPSAMPSPLLSASDYDVQVAVQNTGQRTWRSSGDNPTRLSYHWLDAAGNVVVWDGNRGNFAADVAPGQGASTTVRVRTPQRPGSFTLAWDLVHEGIAWFSWRGAAAHRVALTLSGGYGATYGATTMPASVLLNADQDITVQITNTGQRTWSVAGDSPVRLSYHWLDSAGNVVVWDGNRGPLTADLGPTESATIALKVRTPSRVGAFTLALDLVHEGVSWFSWQGVATKRIPVQVTTGYGATYGADTMQRTASYGEDYDVTVQVTNTGPRSWPAGGGNPVRLSYHWLNASGGVIVWDGNRGTLPKDVAPNETVTVPVRVRVPSNVGTYTLTWDLVHEGVTWFSWQNVAQKAVGIDVPGVVLYGKGWGHGVGLSQWGAQGWATGATGGAPLSGEQIVQKYYPGAAITPLPAGTWFRVLLSSPSNGCVARTITQVAHMRSPNTGLIIRNNYTGALIHESGPNQTVQIRVDANVLKVIVAAGTAFSGANGAVSVEPSQGRPPIVVDQKAHTYRGWIRFSVGGTNTLRAVNHVPADDYTRGAVPAEMPTTTGWHVEAFKAQAYAARTYAANRAGGATGRDYDVLDDTRDQCYGGFDVEKPDTETATVATAGKILTFNGAPINAYYSSSNGGSTESNGCVWGLAGGPPYSCGASDPYLPSGLADPADLAAADNRGPQQHRSWSAVFSPAQIRDAVLRAGGPDIGTLVRFDISNRSPSGRAVSVKVFGTAASAELRADSFLRLHLALKSTLVRTAPF